MAKGNAKQAHKGNKEWLATQQYIIIGVNAAVVLYHLLIAGDLLSFSVILGILFYLGQELGALKILKTEAQPVLDQDDNIVECKNLRDTAALGPIVSFAIDMLWTCVAVQALGLIFSWAGWLWFAVPAIGVYKMWGVFGSLLGMFGGGGGGDQPLPNMPGMGAPQRGHGRMDGESRKDRRVREAQERKAEKIASRRK
eukprot:Hpha_TRINITY_DN16746_c3_g4::TRINITY_DN16746_c3_g4_i1::g.76752::m.76752